MLLSVAPLVKIKLSVFLAPSEFTILSFALLSSVEILKAEFGREMAICELLEKIKICASRGEARRLIEQGGISIDGDKVQDFKMMVPAKNEMVIKKGKKIFVKVVIK